MAAACDMGLPFAVLILTGTVGISSGLLVIRESTNCTVDTSDGLIDLSALANIDGTPR